MKTQFDGLSEFIRRRGRTKILERLAKKLGSYQRIAREIDVNRATVSKWANKENVHPSNESTEKMLDLLEGVDRKSLESILVEEAKTFLESLRKITKTTPSKISSRQLAQRV